MTNVEKIGQREEIYQQIQKLREEAIKADAQIRGCVERRNELNQLVKKARDEVDTLKVERDTINEKVKQLKLQRDAIRTQMDPINEEIKTIREKITKLKKTLPRESQRELQEEHDAIEWKISTTSLDLQQEKRLIENVKEIELLLSGYKKIDAQNVKLRDLFAKRKVFEDQADVLHKEVTDLAAKSQAIHSTLMEKVNTMRVSKAQADAQHQSYISTKDEVLPSIYVKIAELTGQLQSVKASIAEEAKVEANIRRLQRIAEQEANRQRVQTVKQRQQVQQEKQQAIKEKLGAEARDKLQKGEKLSWNEFQLMMSDDSKEESETQDN